MNKRILLLEESDYLGRSIKYKLETELGDHVVWHRDINKFMGKDHNLNIIDLVIIDYDLKGYTKSNILDFFFSKKLPILLLSDEITSDIQLNINDLKVIDYVLKGTNHTLESIYDVTKRYFTNHKIGILIVDDCEETRGNLCKLLHIHRYRVFEADSQNVCLDILKENYNEIQLVITDHNLPTLNGLNLTSTLRKSYAVDRLAIIGISTIVNDTLKIQFIKSGANDFLPKPFINELLYCRITQNLKIVEYFQQIKELAVIDQLTELNNRHFLKETGMMIYENAKRNNFSLVVAMIDIDNFKVINDTYGHDAGDIVLKEISYEFKKYVRKSDIVIRYGGEEFLILGNNLSPLHAETFFNNLRLLISRKVIDIGREKISVTISIGLCTKLMDNLESIINFADQKLYDAKTSGKNKVCT